MPQDRRNRVTKPYSVKPIFKINIPKPGKKGSPPEVLFPTKLDDIGFAKLVAEELSLRDVIQTMRYIRSHMFTYVDPMQFQSSIMGPKILFHACIPPIATLGHINAILTSPSKVDREVAELLDRGAVRKIRVESRRGIGEVLIEAKEYESMVSKNEVLSEVNKNRFLRFLKEKPRAQVVPAGALPQETADQLIRAGLLTSRLHNASAGAGTLRVRPEDRTTLTSVERVSRHASGSVSAVGGSEAIHLTGGSAGGAGGGGDGGGRHPSSELFDYRIAIPGHGRFMKVTEGVVDWIKSLLGRTKWGEGTEAWLKERFESGEMFGRRWKEFYGVEWEWALGEAVGLGVVEVFATGSVGRGVRALGG